MNINNLKKFAINVSLAKEEEEKRKLKKEHQEEIPEDYFSIYPVDNWDWEYNGQK